MSSAATYTYSFGQAAWWTDVWTSGTSWDAVPVSGADTAVIFQPYRYYENITNGNSPTTNEGSSAFQLNSLTFRGGTTGFFGNYQITSTIIDSGVSGSAFNFTNSSTGVAPRINLDANISVSTDYPGRTYYGPISYIVDVPITLSNSLTLAGNGTGTFVFNGAIGGPGGLTKTGSSAVTLAGPNTYTGGTVMQEGTLTLGGSNTATGVTTVTGGTLVVEGQNTVLGSTTLSGGTLVVDGQNTVFGSTTLLGGTLVVDGQNTVFGSTTLLGGTLRLAGASATLADTTITGGTLQIATTSASIPTVSLSSGRIEIQAAGSGATIGALAISGGTFDLGGYSATLSSLSGSGGTITNGSLTLNQSTDTTFGGTFLNTALTKQGAGTLTLTSFDPTLTLSIDGGTVKFSNVVIPHGWTSSSGGNGTLLFEGDNNVLAGNASIGTGLTLADARNARLTAETWSDHGDQVLDIGGTLTLGKNAFLSSGSLPRSHFIVNANGGAVIEIPSYARFDRLEIYLNATLNIPSGQSLVVRDGPYLNRFDAPGYGFLYSDGGVVNNYGTIDVGTSLQIYASINNYGTFRKTGGFLDVMDGVFDNQGIVQTDVDFSIPLVAQLQEGALTGGTWITNRVLRIGGGTIGTNQGDITLGAGGSLLAANASLESTLTTNANALRLTGGRGFGAAKALSNTGLIQLTGGTFSAPSLANQTGGTFSGYGTLAGPVSNAGTIRATGGALALTGALTDAAGAYVIDAGASLGLTSGTVGAISGAGSFSKNGSGTLTVTGNGTYNGATTIADGTLLLGNGGNIGSSTALSISGGASFDLGNRTQTVATLNATSTTARIAYGTLNVSNGGTFDGFLDFGTVVASGGTLTLGGDRDNYFGTAFVNHGGTLILAKTNSSVHAVGGENIVLTIDNGGTARIGGAGQDQIYFRGDVELKTGGTFDLNGHNEGFDNLIGGGTVTNTAAGTTSTLTLGEGNGDAAFAGSLQNGGGILALTKTGSGTLTLSGNSTYTGETTVNAGTLALQGGLYDRGNLAGSVSVNSGGTLLLQGSDLFGAGRSNSPSRLTLNEGGLVKNEAGYFNTFTDLTLNGGELRADGGGSTAFPAYQLKGTVTVGGSVASAITTTGAAFSGITLGNNTDGGVTTFDVNDVTGNGNADLTISASLANGNAGSPSFTEVASGIRKTGTGTLRLSGANSYSGGTTIQDGTLIVAHDQAVGTGTVTVEGGIFFVGNAVTIANPVVLSGGSYERGFQAGANLANAVNATSAFAGGRPDTTTKILQGTLADAGTLGTSFQATSSALNDEIRLSDVYSLHGTGTNAFVLQLSIARLNAGDYLGWLDLDIHSATYNQWVNAVFGNDGGTPTFFARAYNSSTDFHLGYFGVDVAGGTVWAVLNHNSDFAVVPEPATWGLLTGAGLLLLAARRRKIR